MTTFGKAPEDCQSMVELRVEIDAIDDALIALLARRAGYIDRAVPLKIKEGLPPRTTGRVAEVLARVRAKAEARGLDPELSAGLWTTLIDWGIAREERMMGS